MISAQAVLAVLIAALATGSITGYVVAGVAALAGIALLVRRNGRGLVDLARERLRDPAGEPTGLPRPLGTDPDPIGLDLGAATRLLPGLHVAEITPRRSGTVGIVGDGQGFALVLEAEIASSRPWAFADLMDLVLNDPARPAAVQLLMEQRGRARPATTSRFGPAETYRSLPTSGVPLWNRVLVVVRHEPAWAPETVAMRGGGAPGARAALAATAGRIVAAARRSGTRLRPLDAPQVAALFRDAGDPGPDCEARPDAWITSTACHAVVSVAADEEHVIGTILRTTPEVDVDRCVLSLTASAVDHTACAVLRLVATDLAQVEQSAAELVERGLAAPLTGAQDAGVVATLPLGGGARSLADLVNQVRS